jgi:hypothetical protein
MMIWKPNLNALSVHMNGDKWELRNKLEVILSEELNNTTVHVATSGGMDSSALVVAAMTIGVEPIVTSFTLDDRESTDFIAARKLAKYFDLKFVPVFVPTDNDFVVQSTLDNMARYKLRKKADIECLYPIIYMINYIKELGATDLMMGHGADGHFCLSKKGMIHFRHTIEGLQKYRQEHYTKGPLGQRKIYYKICENFNIKYHDPYWNKIIYDTFFNCSWDELNKPKQKQPLRSAFPELDSLKVKNHTNLQLGDSGIAEIVGKSMQARFAPKSKSPISAYNAVVRRGLVETRI